jgi:hypothetical protein
MVASFLSAASSCTVGATPCAENMTVELSGISAVCSTKIAPFFSGVCATYLLWTISWQTQTGAPCTSRACSTAWMARTTPTQ